MMKVHNVHERVIGAPIERIEPLLAGMGLPGDVVWPSPQWWPMVLDRPLSAGATGGHGPIRYTVTAYEPGRLAEFTFEPGLGMVGTHTFTVVPLGPERTLLRHVIAAAARGPAVLLWPAVIRFGHDTVVEQIFDRIEAAVGRAPARPTAASQPARLLCWLQRPRASATAVPATELLATALPRVDHADAFAVEKRPGMPDDPAVWAAAMTADRPAWVAGLMALRERLVGLVGIERTSSSAFDVRARTDAEALAGSDARHLDFRVSILVEQARVVLSTVVQHHNRRGRIYFALIRPAHRLVVASMLTRAAARLARVAGQTGSSGAGSPSASAISGGIGRLPEKSAATTT